MTAVTPSQDGLADDDDDGRPVTRDSPGRIVDSTRFDPEAAATAAAALLDAIGADRGHPGVAGTPTRIAGALAELLTPEPFNPTTFPNEGDYDGLVLVREIPFHTLCMHHLLPFHGVAHVAYLPGDRIVGLSKLARVVDHFARDLQVQERMTVQIADWLEAELSPKGVGVVLSAEHTCMTLRGVHKPGAKTTTSALRGLVRADPRTRQEFLSLVG